MKTNVFKIAAFCILIVWAADAQAQYSKLAQTWKAVAVGKVAQGVNSALNYTPPVGSMPGAGIGVSGVSGQRAPEIKLPSFDGALAKMPAEIPRIKSPYDEAYERLMPEVLSGKHDTVPSRLLWVGSMAASRGDSLFAEFCLMKAMTERLSLDDVATYSVRGMAGLRHRLPYLTRFVIEKDFIVNSINASEGVRSAGDDDLSVAVDLCERYAPGYESLARLAYSPRILTDKEAYIDAAVAAIDLKVEYYPLTQEYLYTALANNLSEAGECGEIIDLFSKSPLDAYACTNASLLLLLCDCLVQEGGFEKAEKCRDMARELDPELEAEYNEEIYRNYMDYCVGNPSDFDSAVALVDAGGSDRPIIALELMQRWLENLPQSAEVTCEWVEFDDLPEEWKPNVEAVARMVDYVREDDVPTLIDRQVMMYLNGATGIYFSEYQQQAFSDIISLSEQLPVDGDNDKTFSLLAGIMRANLEAHGLDKPKEAVKWLKKYEKLAGDPTVDRDSASDYFKYLSEAYAKLGKKKQAEKYSLLSAEIQP